MLFGAALALSSASALSQAYPSRPIRWLVGYPAGGGSDVLVRIVAEAMSRDLGQPIVVENQPGASGNLAAASLSRAAADGYTILMADRSTIVVNPVLFKDTGFNPRSDFSSVGSIATVTMILAVGSAIKAADVREFIALAKAKSGELSYASPGPGSQQELTFEIFRLQAGLEVNQIRYKGGPQQMLDVVQGRVSATVGSYSALLPFLSDGSIRPLAAAQKTRLPALPNVPTFAESGVEGLDSPVWNALFTRAGTAPQAVARLTEALSRALKSETVTARIASTGWNPAFATPAELDQWIAADLRIWPPIAKRLNDAAGGSR
jgi:tripartite-type tricarboxylate transporter receptor subunit TctC